MSDEYSDRLARAAEQTSSAADARRLAGAGQRVPEPEGDAADRKAARMIEREARCAHAHVINGVCTECGASIDRMSRFYGIRQNQKP